MPVEVRPDHGRQVSVLEKLYCGSFEHVNTHFPSILQRLLSVKSYVTLRLIKEPQL